MAETNHISEENKVRAENPAEAAQMARMRKIGVVAGIALVVFLLGFVPMWLSARDYKNERDAAQAQLRPSVLQNDLATAAIYARRGEYEQARQQTSDFYTALRAEFERESSVFADAGQREAVQQILAQRDEIITLLARNDASVAERLSDLYFAFMHAKNSAATDENQTQK